MADSEANMEKYIVNISKKTYVDWESVEGVEIRKCFGNSQYECQFITKTGHIYGSTRFKTMKQAKAWLDSLFKKIERRVE